MRLPNGFGSVHKLNGNRRRPYRARVTIEWKNTNDAKVQKYKTIGYYATKEEGILALAEFNKNPYNLDNRNVTFKQIYEMWSREHYNKITPSCQRMWIAAYKHSEVLYNKTFSSLKVIDLECALSDASVGIPTKIRMKELYNMMYKYAIKHEFADKNYATYCEAPAVTESIVRIPFSKDEIKKLWRNVSVPYVDIILVGIYTGMRPSEIINLKKENVNLELGVIIGGMKTESGKNRVVPIHSRILQIIKEKYKNSIDYLFTKNSGERMTYYDYRNRFIKIMNLLVFEHKPHDTRHTFITRAKEYKMDEYVIKLIVGHKISDITENVYTHRDINELKDEMKKIVE